MYPLHLERTEGCIYIGISIDYRRIPHRFHTPCHSLSGFLGCSCMLVVRTTPSPLLLRRRKAPSPFRCYYHPSLLHLPPYASSYTIDYVRSQSAFQRSRVLYPRRELPYTLLSQSRLFQGLPGPFAFPKSTFCTYLTRLPLCSSITRLSSRRILRASARWPAKSRNFSNGFFPLERRKKERVLIVVSQVCWTNTRWWGGARSKWSLIFEEIRSVFHR